MHGEMISIVTEHFSLNRSLLLLIGLWPYQKSIFVRLQIILSHVILISLILTQFAVLLTSDCSMNVLTKILSTGFIYMTCIIHYSSFYFNGSIIKYLLEELQCICDDLKDINEIAIIAKYGSNAKRYTIVFTMAVLCFTWGFIFLLIGISILDIIFPINESRRYRFLQEMVKYYFNKQEHVYLAVSYILIVFTIGIFGLVATGTMILSYLQHACGMFRIASYRLKHAMRADILKNINLRNEYLIYEKIIYAVKMHGKAIKFAESLMSNFNTWFLIIVVTALLSWSINLFQISEVLLSKGISKELIPPVTNFAFQSVYALTCHYIAQDITDHNDFVITTAYDIPWYITSVNIQKEILFILQRGTKTFFLNIGGIYPASLEGLTTLANIAISYFTVMYSMNS